ncbi:patatin-like phospholipase family protein [Neobacillus terrae]|uniref:patatin-like phospholipase family protein n=1 Tax=Neobacillus terrae TaxID=3034837 RepID=UPI00140D7E65|nr:patatin-like phospholipase family protein [Neobacillus terrae]NHM32225.1 patatin-like phospholipase family protein [Neobacillus terrae]
MDIDGVFSGGGVRGLAIIGALNEIEQKGFRFTRVAGTSAGSIVAALVAAGYTSNEIFQQLDEMDLTKFLDIRKTLFPFPFASWLLVYWRLGLYRGKELEKWIAQKLAARGIRTFSDLPPQSLRVIASDLTNGRLVVLPDDLDKYGILPGSFPVAKAIRMSCGIPYFFEPAKLRVAGKANILVDGGVLSNFPMWLFDQENIKMTRPVLGIKLSYSETDHKPHKINNAFQMFAALFETMKDAHDTRYISRKHAKNIIFIPTEGVVSTEFILTDEKKHALFEEGKKYAKQFFRTWGY